MKILMVNKYLYPRAGAETYMISLAKELLLAGHEVAFFGMDHPQNITFAKTYTIPFFEFGKTSSLLSIGVNIAKKAADVLTAATRRKFQHCVEDFRPDIIHAHNIYNQLPPDLFIKVVPVIPVLMTLHDYKPICPSYNLFTQGETCKRCLTGNYFPCIKYSCVHESKFKSAIAAASSANHHRKKTYERGYSHFIAPSKFMKDVHVEGGFNSDSITVIPNFVRPGNPENITKQEFLYAGRLCLEKGLHELLEAYRLLPKPRPALKIAGEGPSSGALKNFAQRENLDEIIWLGKISPEEVQKELSNSAVSLVPSLWYENCPMSILESFAQGRPVIASDLAGNRELIRHGIDGFLVDPKDSQSFADYLQKAISDRESLEKMSTTCFNKVLEEYSPNEHLQKILNVYHL